MREEYDRAKRGPYGEWLRAKGIQTRPSGWTHATHDQAREYVGKDGKRVKDTTDQLGNRVVQHGNDQQSVIVKRLETVTAKIPPPQSREHLMSSPERAVELRAQAEAREALAGLEEDLLAAKAARNNDPTPANQAAVKAASEALREARALTRTEGVSVGGDAYISEEV